jgi:hypothetical protein
MKTEALSSAPPACKTAGLLFAALQLAIEDGDLAAAADAQRALERIGVYVRLRGLRLREPDAGPARRP